LPPSTGDDVLVGEGDVDVVVLVEDFSELWLVLVWRLLELEVCSDVV